MARAAVQRAFDRKHEEKPYHNGAFEDWRAEPDATHLWHYQDGVTLWLSPYDLTPDDDWL